MLSHGRRPSVIMGIQPTPPRGHMPLSRRLVYPLCLLAGSLPAVVAGALHPDIAGQDGPSQLAVIAQSRAWPAIHWAFLFSFPLSLLGLVGVVGRHVGTAGESPARAGVMLATFAYALWVIIVAFMGGAGGGLAPSLAPGDAGGAGPPGAVVVRIARPLPPESPPVAGVGARPATAPV